MGVFRSRQKIGYEYAEHGSGIDYIPILDEAEMNLVLTEFGILGMGLDFAGIMVVEVSVRGYMQAEEAFANIGDNGIAKGCDAYRADIADNENK